MFLCYVEDVEGNFLENVDGYKFLGFELKDRNNDTVLIAIYEKENKVGDSNG